MKKKKKKKKSDMIYILDVFCFIFIGNGNIPPSGYKIDGRPFTELFVVDAKR